jgi:cytochrome P450
VSARPDVEEKIVREIRAARASSGCCETREGALTTTFSFDDELREMHYLHAAITESMRLYPPVTADTHSCKEDDVRALGRHVRRERMARDILRVL